MPAILKLRRGNSLDNLQISEPFYHEVVRSIYVGTDNTPIRLANLNETNVGSFIINGTITTTEMIVNNNMSITGDLTIAGNLYLGDEDTDNIIIKSALSGSMIPSDASSFDLGSTLKPWRHIYADSATIGDLVATSIDYDDITNKPTLVSGSFQVDHDATLNFVSDEHVNHSVLYIYAGSGLSGGGTLTTSRTIHLDVTSEHFINSVKTRLDAESVISGSTQLNGTSIDNLTLTSVNATGGFSGSFSGDGSNLTGVVSYTDTDTELYINSKNVISGSSQLSGDTIDNLTITNGTFDGTVSTDSMMIVSSSYSYSENLDVDSTVPEVIATILVSSCDGIFFDYLVKNGSNVRIGTLLVAHDGTNISYADNSTTDIGDTSGIILSAQITGLNLELIASTTSDNWKIKTLIRTI